MYVNHVEKRAKQTYYYYSTPPHLRYPELRYIRSYAILNWVLKTPS